AVTPSTPAVRAPLLLRTRIHPASRKAGSQTRLCRSSNRRRGSSAAQRCSLAWIFSTRRSAAYATSSSSSVFTNDLLAFQLPHCRLAGPLRHVRAFRALGLLRVLRPTPRPSAGDGPAPAPGLEGQRGGGLGWFPRSLCADRPGWVPCFAPTASPCLRRSPSARPPDPKTSRIPESAARM